MRVMKWIVLLCFCGCTGYVRKAYEVPALQGMGAGGVPGLSIVVEADEWGGTARISQKITPVKVTIHNWTGKLLKLQYSQFFFRGKKSNRIYGAMPPFEVLGTPETPCIVLPYPFPVESAIECNSKFMVAHYCARMYPGLPAFYRNFTVDTTYYNRYYCKWARIKLPTVELLSKLLPDGVIGHNGYVSGYLYFEKAAASEEEMEFCADLYDVFRDLPVGTVRIPFQVIKK